MPVHGLEYLITLNDQISKPLKAIKGELDRIGDVGKDAMMKIGAGAAGVAATGASLYAALQPAIELTDALSNITATGMSDQSLDKVKRFALGFSSEFGVAAVEVVDSANEIIRAIDGLTDEEVIAFTRSSNLLSKATASSVTEMGSYLGTMYGIFKAEADKMGKAQWIEQMAGQATLTANMFKSSGESISQAFTNLMATGQSKGVALAEQFAVLGNLQSVMPGGMSGTKYGAFLKGVGKAQAKLGLSFLDSQKRMKPITEILSEIKKAYGDTIDEVEAMQLSKAFGSDDAVAVISYLLPKIGELRNNIDQIDDVSNLDDAAKTAKIVTSVWERLSQIFTNIRAAIGAPVLKKITPFFDKLADMGASFVEWLDTYKNIARWLGYIVGGVIALTAVVPIVMLLIGLFKVWGLALVALKLPFLALGGASQLVFGSISGFLLNLVKLGSPVQLMLVGIKKLTLALLLPFKALWGLSKGMLLFFKSGFLAVIAVAKSFFLALTISPLLTLKAVGAGLWGSFLTGIKLLLSPMSLWIGLFVGLGLFIYQFRSEIQAFFAGVIKGFTEWGISFEPVKNGFLRIWEALKRIFNVFTGLFGVTTSSQASLSEWASVGEMVGAGLAWTFQNVLDVIELIASLIEQVASIFEDVAVIIINAWQDVLAAWGNNDIWGVFNAIGSGITNIFTRVLHGVKNMFFTFLNWLIDKVNSLGSYIGIELPKIAMAEMPTPEIVPQLKNASAGTANLALQMASQVGAQQLAPKPDSNGQVFSLGSANPPKLEKSPQLNKTMNTTQHNYRNVTIQKIEVNSSKDAMREVKELQELS